MQVCSAQPAQLYGLQDRKGTIAPGMDADLVIWYPTGQLRETITNDMLHHDIDHTVFEGTEVTNWPRSVGDIDYSTWVASLILTGTPFFEVRWLGIGKAKVS